MVRKDVPPGCLVGEIRRGLFVLSIRMQWSAFRGQGGGRALEIPRPKVPSVGEDDIRMLMQRLQRLVKVREVKEELKRRME